jgi:hypothetical protein
MRGWVIALLVLSGCANGPNAVYDRDIATLRSYVNEEVSSGRMTPTQGEYYFVRERSNLDMVKEAKKAQGWAMLGIGSSMVQPAQPIGTRCITTQQGATQQTVCH